MEPFLRSPGQAKLQVPTSRGTCEGPEAGGRTSREVSEGRLGEWGPSRWCSLGSEGLQLGSGISLQQPL